MLSEIAKTVSRHKCLGCLKRHSLRAPSSSSSMLPSIGIAVLPFDVSPATLDILFCSKSRPPLRRRRWRAQSWIFISRLSIPEFVISSGIPRVKRRSKRHHWIIASIIFRVCASGLSPLVLSDETRPWKSNRLRIVFSLRRIFLFLRIELPESRKCIAARKGRESSEFQYESERRRDSRESGHVLQNSFFCFANRFARIDSCESAKRWCANRLPTKRLRLCSGCTDYEFRKILQQMGVL